MTPLEALEKIKAKHYFVDFELDTTVGKDCKEELDIIETALKEYEGAKQHIEALHKERVENSLKLKAFEIIKKKGIDVQVLIWSNTCAEYNANAKACVGYTQEEYETVVGVIL